MDQATASNSRGLWIILLAAGGSRRLGAAKQLLRMRGSTLLRRALTLAHEIGGPRVITVLGSDIHRMRAHVRRSGSPTKIVFNRAWRQGIGTSLAAGIAALPASADAALVLLCDQPMISAQAIAGLCQAHRRRPGYVAAARYAGRVGVPAVFPRRFFAELKRLSTDQGARALLNETRSMPVIALDMPAAATDVDTPADAAKLR